jgi:hypothetical protein
MHKNIAKLINKMVKESPYNNFLFSCEIIPNPLKGSSGFWKLILTFKTKGRNDAHSASLMESLHYIGMVYGESLSIINEGKRVEVN